jgi:hydroxymethylglutaryl-CoA lyase
MKMPKKMLLVDVAPRDGLQSLPKWIPTDEKVWLCDRLTDLGVPVVEVASFAHPKVVPNMRDAEEVFARIRRKPGVVYRGQAPNVRGAHRAIEAKVGEMLGLITVSETYTHHNQNMSNDECVEQNIQSFRLADRAGIPFVMAVGMAFWCPYEGLVPEAQVEDIVGRFSHAGIKRQYLAGSIGMEDPAHVNRLFRSSTRSIPASSSASTSTTSRHGDRQHPRRDGRGRALARGRDLRHRRRHGDPHDRGQGGQLPARGPGDDARGDGRRHGLKASEVIRAAQEIGKRLGIPSTATAAPAARART